MVNPVISSAEVVTNKPSGNVPVTKLSAISAAKGDSFAYALQQVKAAHAQGGPSADAAETSPSLASLKRSTTTMPSRVESAADNAGEPAVVPQIQAAIAVADLAKSETELTKETAEFAKVGSSPQGVADLVQHGLALSKKGEHEVGKKVQHAMDATVNAAPAAMADALTDVPAVSAAAEANVAAIPMANAILRPVSASVKASGEKSAAPNALAWSTRANVDVRAALAGASNDAQAGAMAVQSPNAAEAAESAAGHDAKISSPLQAVTEASSKVETVLSAAGALSAHRVVGGARLGAGERLTTASQVPAREITLRSIEAAAPDRLEVGVTGGTAGWLTVRTQLAQDGSVHAMLRGAAAAATELHAQKSELAEFLSSHGVSVSRLDVEAVRVATAAKVSADNEHFSGSLSERGAQQGQQQSRHERGRPSGTWGINPAESTVVSGTVRTPLFAAMASGAALASTGGWLSVRV